MTLKSRRRGCFQRCVGLQVPRRMGNPASVLPTTPTNTQSPTLGPGDFPGPLVQLWELGWMALLLSSFVLGAQRSGAPWGPGFHLAYFSHKTRGTG